MIWTWRTGRWERRVWEKGISCWGGCWVVWRGVCWGDFCWDFSDGGGWGASCCLGDCPGGCCGVTFDDDWWVSFSERGGGGWVQSFFLALVSPPSLRLFRFVVVSISPGCSSSVFFFLVFFLIFWWVMEVAMEVEVEVVKIFLVQLVLVLSLLIFWWLFLLLILLLVLLFYESGFPLSGHLDPPFVRFVWIVPRIGGWAGGFSRVTVVDVAVDGWLLRAGSS